MDLIVETDIGRDPDDFLALCYLVEAGVDTRLVTISPGDPDQVAVARFLLEECGLDSVPVGVGRGGRDKSSVGGVHLELLERYGRPQRSDPDGLGSDLMHSVLGERPECSLFCCGPLDSVGGLLGSHRDSSFARTTVQGGFVGYQELERAGIRPRPRLAKFEGMDFCSSFNPGANIRATQAFLRAHVRGPRRFVSKNVCHGLVWDQQVQTRAKGTAPRTRGGELLREGMALYLASHPDGKKVHDPAAAVLHLHPEIGEWARGRLILKRRRGWGFDTSQPDAGHEIIGAIDEAALWDHLLQGSK